MEQGELTSHCFFLDDKPSMHTADTQRDFSKHQTMLVCLLVAGLGTIGNVSFAANHDVRKRGQLHIQCSVDGARVEIDGSVVGRTPLPATALVPGVHRIVVKKKGYSSFVRDVRLQAGINIRIAVQMQPLSVSKKKRLASQDKAERFKKKKRNPNQDAGLLDLTPIPVKRPKASKKHRSGFDDRLQLMPLVKQEAQTEVHDPIGVAHTKEVGAAPWYQEWWVWTAAAGAIALVSTVVVLTTHQTDSTPARRASCWKVGEGEPHSCVVQ